MLDGVELGRIGGQLVDAQAIGVSGDILLGRGDEAIGLAAVEQASGEVVDRAEDFVRLARAAGLEKRLRAEGLLSAGEQAPLRETGLLPKSSKAPRWRAVRKVASHSRSIQARRRPSSRWSEMKRAFW